MVGGWLGIRVQSGRELWSPARDVGWLWRGCKAVNRPKLSPPPARPTHPGTRLLVLSIFFKSRNTLWRGDKYCWLTRQIKKSDTKPKKKSGLSIAGQLLQPTQGPGSVLSKSLAEKLLIAMACNATNPRPPVQKLSLHPRRPQLIFCKVYLPHRALSNAPIICTLRTILYFSCIKSHWFMLWLGIYSAQAVMNTTGWLWIEILR